VQTLPGAHRAALEVCTELASYCKWADGSLDQATSYFLSVAKRYPAVFRVQRAHDKGGLGQGDSIVGKSEGRVKTIEIIPTGDKWDLDVDDPMTVAGLLADDLGVMMEGSDGRYYLQAGSICVPGKSFTGMFFSSMNFRRFLENCRQDWPSPRGNSYKGKCLQI